jgi:hypothetical protein
MPNLTPLTNDCANTDTQFPFKSPFAGQQLLKQLIQINIAAHKEAGTYLDNKQIGNR